MNVFFGAAFFLLMEEAGVADRKPPIFDRKTNPSQLRLESQPQVSSLVMTVATSKTTRPPMSVCIHTDLKNKIEGSLYSGLVCRYTDLKIK